MMLETELFKYDYGSIEAPAGCGKTQFIVNSIASADSSKPILVLTHTNAGIAAIKQRLKDKNISQSKYIISTIDSWIISMVRHFPQRSGIPNNFFQGQNIDYPKLEHYGNNLLKQHFFKELLANSYYALLVDEYQDCSEIQHSNIVEISRSIKTFVFGDPLQAIFNFRDSRCVPWEQVKRDFNPIETLSTPWRWINANSKPLGEWLLEIRTNLLNKKQIDLKSAPTEHLEIKPIKNPFNLDLSFLYQTKGSVLLIGDSKNDSQRINLVKTYKQICFVEPLELKNLIRFAQKFDNSSDPETSLNLIFEIVRDVMTNTQIPNLKKRLTTISAGRSHKEISELEKLCIEYKDKPCHSLAADIIKKFSENPKCHVYRRTIFNAVIQIFKYSKENNCSVLESAITYREQNRRKVQVLPRIAIGSTLLLKGLEADTVVITNYDQLCHDPENLYVALTRGARKIILFSKIHN